jgi:hypothetical protein
MHRHRGFFWPAFFILSFTFAAAHSATLYVSPAGSDDWSGVLATPNGERSEGPLATLPAACERIKQIRAEQNEAVTVLIRSGYHSLAEPWLLDSALTGSPDAPVVFAAYPGEEPIIGGGRAIEGWQPTEINGQAGWVTNLPEVAEGKWWFRELFVNGERLPRTRLPETGYYTFLAPIDASGESSWNHGSLGAVFEEGEIQDWKNPSDIEIVGLTRWIETRMPIASIDHASNTVTFGHRSTFRLENTRPGVGRAARYYVENVFEALDRPGEWYLERSSGNLYYLPRPGENPETTLAMAPALPQILRVVGTQSAPVTNLRFENLIFQHAEWNYPEGDAGSVQAAFEVPGAVYLENASHCEFLSCAIEQVGNYGLEIGQGCDSNLVSRCHLHDLGAGGIKLGHLSFRSEVSDCVIAQGGRIHHSGVGVWIGNSGHNTVIHNDIHDFFYTGISVGWSWGYGPSEAVANRIEYNHIHNIGQGMLSDMGGIYTLGISEGTRLTHNHIHDVSSYAYGGWGIYPDEGSTHILVENNLVYRTKTGGFHQHYGKENMIRNNIFAYAVEQQLQRSREEEHKSFDFVHNIVLFDQGVLLGSTWKNDRFVMDNNLYWNTSDPDFEFAGGTFEDWKARGHDQNSMVADPLFRNPQEGDFTLAANSPALELGFEPFDVSMAGPRPQRPLRTTIHGDSTDRRNDDQSGCGRMPSDWLNEAARPLGLNWK